MRTSREIWTDILEKRKAAAPLLSSQFSFCVGGNMLTYVISPEEYRVLVQDNCLGKDNVLLGYSLVIE